MGYEDSYLDLVERILVGPCSLRPVEVDSLLGRRLGGQPTINWCCPFFLRDSLTIFWRAANNSKNLVSGRGPFSFPGK